MAAILSIPVQQTTPLYCFRLDTYSAFEERRQIVLAHGSEHGQQDTMRLLALHIQQGIV
jgi:hypothetical protein